MKKHITSLMACLMVALMAIMTLPQKAMAEYGQVTVPRIGTNEYPQIDTPGLQVGKVIGVEAVNVITNGTIIISMDAGTNVLSTLTVTVPSGGRQFFDLSSSGWFYWASGEKYYRSGTDTNSWLRIIYDK